MKVLVTGAAGFIGFHLCAALLKRGDAVVGFDNLNDYYDVSLKEARLARLRELGGDFGFVKGSLEDMEALRGGVRGKRVRPGSTGSSTWRRRRGCGIR